MPIRFAAERPDAAALVRSGLERLTRRPTPPPSLGRESAALALDSPHPVYDLRADEIAAGGGLETAHATGLRYLVTSPGGGPVAAAEVQTDSSGAASVLANINYGPFVEGTATSFAQLTTSSAIGSASYEVRLLRFSAIYLVAVWLKGEGSATDLIVPVAPAPPGLEAGVTYSVADFLRIIRPLAAGRTSTTETHAVP